MLHGDMLIPNETSSVSSTSSSSASQHPYYPDFEHINNTTSKKSNNINKFTDYSGTAHLQNNSVSSSLSSSSSATNSSYTPGTNPQGNSTNTNSLPHNKYNFTRKGSKNDCQFSLINDSTPINMAKKNSISQQKLEDINNFLTYFQNGALNSSTPINHSLYNHTSTDVESKTNAQATSNRVNKNKSSMLSDRFLVQQAKITNHHLKNGTANSYNINTKLKKNSYSLCQNQFDPSQKTSQSYTYHTHNQNRLSSYDNDLLPNYQDFYESKNESKKFNRKKISEIDFGNSTVNSKRAFMGCSALKNSNDQPSVELLSCINNSSSETNCISNNNILNQSNTTQSNSHNNNNSNNNNKNSNVFTRAFNYAKKTATGSTSSKQSWRSKLGKYFLQSNSSSKAKSAEKESVDACNIIIDEDIYSAYHLSRKQPIKAEHLSKNKMKLPAQIIPSSSSSSSNASPYLNNLPLSHNTNHHVFADNSNIQQQPVEINKHLKKNKSKSLVSNIDNNLEPQTNFTSKSIINNGFNSLRKILKIPGSHRQSQQQLNKQKCMSQSTTPIPGCLTTSFTQPHNTQHQTSDEIQPKTGNLEKRDSIKQKSTHLRSSPNHSFPSLCSPEPSSPSSVNNNQATNVSSKAENVPCSEIMAKKTKCLSNSTVLADTQLKNKEKLYLKNTNAQNNGKMVNMLKAYKNVLNKMNKAPITDNSKISSSSSNKKFASTKVFQSTENNNKLDDKNIDVGKLIQKNRRMKLKLETELLKNATLSYSSNKEKSNNQHRRAASIDFDNHINTLDNDNQYSSFNKENVRNFDLDF